jgi:hypothetical protein
MISLSRWEREGARSAQPSGKGEGSLIVSALTLPPLRGSLPYQVNSAPRCLGHAGGMTDLIRLKGEGL